MRGTNWAEVGMAWCTICNGHNTLMFDAFLISLFLGLELKIKKSDVLLGSCRGLLKSTEHCPHAFSNTLLEVALALNHLWTIAYLLLAELISSPKLRCNDSLIHLTAISGSASIKVWVWSWLVLLKDRWVGILFGSGTIADTSLRNLRILLVLNLTNVSFSMLRFQWSLRRCLHKVWKASLVRHWLIY